ncbi:MAG: LysR family transcriptional regulator [Sporolactobacillus sp.]
MDIIEIESFLIIAKEKSISKAAEYLHITQPTLSIRIKKLEKSLGFCLIRRSWEGTTLTQEGFYFLPYAVQLMQNLKDSRLILTEEFHRIMEIRYQELSEKSAVRIGIDTWLTHIFSYKIIEFFQRNYPSVDCQIVAQSSQTLTNMIDFNLLDIAIRYNLFAKDDTINLILSDDLLLVYCSKIRVHFNGQNFTGTELESLPFLIFDNPVLIYHSAYTFPIFRKLKIKHYKTINDVTVMLNLIALGKAYTIIPKSCLHAYLMSDMKLPLRIINLGEILPKLFIEMISSPRFNHLHDRSELSKKLIALLKDIK